MYWKYWNNILKRAYKEVKNDLGLKSITSIFVQTIILILLIGFFISYKQLIEKVTLSIVTTISFVIVAFLKFNFKLISIPPKLQNETIQKCNKIYTSCDFIGSTVIGLDDEGNMIFSPKSSKPKENENTHIHINFKNGFLEIIDSNNILGVTDVGNKTLSLNFKNNLHDDNFYCEILADFKPEYKIFDKSKSGLSIKFIKDIPSDFKLTCK